MNRFQCLNAFQLKILAIIFMTIDHIGAILFPYEMLYRQIGRLAFPIYCFLIVEGVVHSRDVKMYLLRLGVFALISEIPFDWAFRGVLFYWESQNVFFTLFLGALAIWLWSTYDKLHIRVGAIVVILCVAEAVSCDYGALGVLLIIMLYVTRENLLGVLGSLIYINGICFEGTLQTYAVLSFIPLAFYNGKRGYPVRAPFYIYYPLHLTILGIIGNIWM